MTLMNIHSADAGVFASLSVGLILMLLVFGAYVVYTSDFSVDSIVNLSGTVVLFGTSFYLTEKRIFQDYREMNEK